MSSAKFIVNKIQQIFDNGLIRLVELYFVLFRVLFENGGYECFLHIVEGCAMHTWPDVNKYYPFISCVERYNVLDGKWAFWEACYKQFGLDRKVIEDCQGNGIAEKFQLEYAKETKILKPPLKSLPWVVVDGVPLKGRYNQVVRYICHAYKGIIIPEWCMGMSPSDGVSGTAPGPAPANPA